MSTLFDIEPTALVVPDNTVTRDQLPNLADYDLIVGNLSGGKDSWLMQSVLMDAARAAGVADRVWTFHATLGPLEWPGVEYGGQYYPSVSELAAQQSAASGVPAERHIEATKLTLDDDPEPYDLLTYIAAYGCFPRLGTRYCTKAFKEQVEDASFTPIINGLKVKLGLATKPNAVKLTRRVRRLKSLGLRSDESRDRAARPAYRNVMTNGVRHLDEWCPAKDWTTQQVKDFHAETGFPHHWTYDSHPGAGDWAGTSRCSCSFCILGSKRDLLISVQRRPRLAELIAHVETVRGDTFRPDISMHELIALSRQPGAPKGGVVIPDETPEFQATKASVMDALSKPPRKETRLAGRPRTSLPLLTDTCASCNRCA
ncbi:phosphoadenosine phosphosulfate reductase [Streptomyces sp. IBSBF 2953]|nr:phosphoadenosine phosphosulfate reductase [Streptomyces hayashii]